MAEYNGEYVSTGTYFMLLGKDNPFQVKVKNYMTRMKAGKIPKRHELKVTSWVTYRNIKDGHFVDNTVCFGFKTMEGLVAFVEKYDLKEFLSAKKADE